MAALAARVATSFGECTLLPLAIEYPFWDERLPETLLGFAEPVRVMAGEMAETVQQRAVDALQGALSEMQAKAIARSPAGFQLLASGSLGAGGFYALGQRIKALVTRRPYIAEHTPMAKMQEGTK
jgi:hypothetical protein